MSVNTLHYIKKPAKEGLENPKPIFLIHGYGSDENDLFSFAESLPNHYYIISVFGNALG
jgi:phospholipase/carboxylesterase